MNIDIAIGILCGVCVTLFVRSITQGAAIRKINRRLDRFSNALADSAPIVDNGQSKELKFFFNRLRKE